MGKHNKHRKWWQQHDVATVEATKPVPRASISYGHGASDYFHEHDDAPVFTVGKTRVFGGKRTEMLRRPRTWDFVIAASGARDAPEPTIVASPSARAMVEAAGIPAAAPPPWIAIDWNDMGVPHLGRRDWDGIARLVRSVDGDVAIYCMGGHGRTGTTLAILETLLGAVPAGADPVAWLRARYCPEAVETEAQCRYVAAITGRKVSAPPSEDRRFDFPDKGTPRTFTPSTGTASVGQSTKAVIGPVPQAGGSDARPILNKAGDVIGWDYTSSPPGTEIDVDKPWQRWGT